MKNFRIDEIHKNGILQDFFISLLVFTVFSFIDIELAFFVAIICIAILLSRRIIVDLNPGFINGHRIYYKGEELKVPTGVDIFNLGNINHLVTYVGVVRNILAPPRIIIIRFKSKSRISEEEIGKLFQVIKLLEQAKISILFSDVNATVQNQFRQNGISKRVRESNIFFYVKDALEHSKQSLKEVK